jgi:hypothetical protein
MRADLSPEQWHAVEEGRVAAPDGRVFSRRTTREKRKAVATLVEAGAPFVTYWPGGMPEHTRLIWHDEDDARSAWAEVRPKLTSETPDPRKGTSATAGRWETSEGEPLVVVTWHH